MADVMVPATERSEFMYELRGIAENVVRERLEHLQVHPPVRRGHGPFKRCKVQESFRESTDNLGVADASEAEQPPPHSPHGTSDSTSTPTDSQAVPAFVIPMTQEKTLQELPSQLDFEWHDYVAPDPTPVVAAASVVPPIDPDVNSFEQVSQISSEAVKNATEVPEDN